MKMIIMGIIMAMSLAYASAQEQNNEMDYQHYADSATANLDISKIPFGVLYDKVEPLSNLDIFVQGNDSTRSSTIHFFQAVNELMPLKVLSP